LKLFALHDMTFVGPNGVGTETLTKGTPVTALTDSEIARLDTDTRLGWYGGKVHFWGHDLRLPSDNSARGIVGPQDREYRIAERNNRTPMVIVPFMWNERFRYATLGIDLDRHPPGERMETGAPVNTIDMDFRRLK